MFTEGVYLPMSVASGIIPAPQLLIATGHAWVLIVALLVSCCAGLWFLTAPRGVGRAVSRSTSSRRKDQRKDVSRSRDKGKKRFAVVSPPIPLGD